jgi:hypothetical protein
MNINQMTFDQKITLLGVLSNGCKESELRDQIIKTFKSEPIQETKDPEPERFEIGEEVEVIDVSTTHCFKIGEILKIDDISEFNKNNYFCINSVGSKRFVSSQDIKKLPKQTINKDELRKHLEAVDTLWQKTPGSLSVSINKYLETL